MASTISSPIKSASSNGPIGYPSPSLHALSISSYEARPLSYILIDSRMNGTSKAFPINAGVSFVITGSLPKNLANSVAKFIYLSSVFLDGITSISFITGGGLKKWKPINLSGFLRLAAISITGIDDVFVKIGLSSSMISSTFLKISCFNLSSSFTTSIVKESGGISAKFIVPFSLLRFSFTSSPFIFPLFMPAS
jgi:hypothetical protein